MHRQLLTLLLIAAVTMIAACGPKRMAPFAPHRPDSDFHRAAQAYQACLGCHEVKSIRTEHQASDDCLKCHRILQGE